MGSMPLDSNCMALPHKILRKSHNMQSKHTCCWFLTSETAPFFLQSTSAGATKSAYLKPLLLPIPNPVPFSSGLHASHAYNPSRIQSSYKVALPMERGSH